MEPDQQDGRIIMGVSAATALIALLVLLFGISVSSQLLREPSPLPSHRATSVAQTPLPQRPGADGQPSTEGIIVPPDATLTAEIPEIELTQSATVSITTIGIDTVTVEAETTVTVSSTPEGDATAAPTQTAAVTTPSAGAASVTPPTDPVQTPSTAMKNTVPPPTALPSATSAGYPPPNATPISTATPTATPEGYP